MTKEQHLELLRYRISQIDEKRTNMYKNIQKMDESQARLTEHIFSLKFGGIEADIETQIEWIEKNL